MSPIDAFDSETYAIIGAAQHVHTVLGRGYLETVYQLALAKTFRKRGIPFEREVDVPVVFEGERLECTYRCDFICYGTVLVELKALTSYSGAEEAQVINYLKAGPLDVGLLINFGQDRLRVQRFASPRRLQETASVSSVDQSASAEG